MISCNIQKYPQRSKLIITVIIEGLSIDEFQFAKTPNMDLLIKNGAISLNTRGCIPDNPYSNLMSIITGAYPNQNGIISGRPLQNLPPQITIDNGFYPSIFYSIKQKNPGLETAFIYDRKELEHFFNTSTIKYKYFSDSLSESINKLKELISSKKINYLLLHTKTLNKIGIKYGWESKEYIKQIEFIDNKIGELYNFLKIKGLIPSTNIIILSTHGEKINTLSNIINYNINSIFIISGAGIIQNKILPNPINTIDYAATVLYMFNYSIPDYIYGKPIFQAFKINKNNYKYKGQYLPKPAISHKNGLYLTPISLKISSYLKGATIHYTLDGSVPSLSSKIYKRPLRLTESATVKAICTKQNLISEVAVFKYKRIKGIKEIILKYNPDTNFINTDPLSLFDGVKAEFNYKNSAWLAFCKQDLHVKIEFTKRKKINIIKLNFLQDTTNLIYLPTKIEIYGSYDGRRYKRVLKYTIPQNEVYKKNQIYTISLETNSKFKYKSVIVKAINRGFLPQYHKNAGEKVWLLIDEIQFY